MEEKDVLTQLVQLLNKYPLTLEETEAIKHAIGILSWTSLRTGALKNMKEKRLEKRRKENR